MCLVLSDLVSQWSGLVSSWVGEIHNSFEKMNAFKCVRRNE